MKINGISSYDKLIKTTSAKKQATNPGKAEVEPSFGNKHNFIKALPAVMLPFALASCMTVKQPPKQNLQYTDNQQPKYYNSEHYSNSQEPEIFQSGGKKSNNNRRKR